MPHSSVIGAIDIAAVVALLVSISVASERLVEVFKNLLGLAAEVPVPPPAATQQPAATEAEKLEAAKRLVEREAAEKLEAGRKAKIQLLAVLCGIITAWMASPAILSLFPKANPTASSSWSLVLVMGFFASSGSAFWREILGYVRGVREIKGAEAEGKKVETAQAAANPAVTR